MALPERLISRQVGPLKRRVDTIAETLLFNHDLSSPTRTRLEQQLHVLRMQRRINARRQQTHLGSKNGLPEQVVFHPSDAPKAYLRNADHQAPLISDHLKILLDNPPPPEIARILGKQCQLKSVVFDHMKVTRDRRIAIKTDTPALAVQITVARHSQDVAVILLRTNEEGYGVAYLRDGDNVDDGHITVRFGSGVAIPFPLRERNEGK